MEEGLEEAWLQTALLQTWPIPALSVLGPYSDLYQNREKRPCEADQQMLCLMGNLRMVRVNSDRCDFYCTSLF